DAATGGAAGAAGATAAILRQIPWDKLRAPLVALQIMIQYISITGIRFPPMLESFFSWIALLTLELGWIFSAPCALGFDFYDKLLALTLMPLALGALFGASHLLAQWRASGDAVRQRRTGRRHLSAVLVLSFFVYSSVSSACFQTFACDNLGGGKSFLRADYSISCDTLTHRSYEVYAGFMALFYAVGIPCFYLFLLWSHRRGFGMRRSESTAAVSRVGSTAAVSRVGSTTTVSKPQERLRDPKLATSRFLWRPYRAPLFYWEVVECGRRLLLTGVLAFILPGSPGQSAVACLLAVVTLAVYAAFWPLEDRLDGYAYVLSCFTIFAVMFLGLVMEAEVSGDTNGSGTVLAMLVVVLTVFLVAAVLLQLVLAAVG
ncbi:unnamed protein product, partial [Phaeothamnion confervicola]